MATQQTRSSEFGAFRRSVDRSTLIGAAGLLVSAGGTAILSRGFWIQPESAWITPSGVLVLACGGWLLLLSWLAKPIKQRAVTPHLYLGRGWRRGGIAVPRGLRATDFARILLVGFAVVYGTCLVVGPRPGIWAIMLAACAVWLAIVISLALCPPQHAWLKMAATNRAVRRLGSLVWCGLVLACGIEGALAVGDMALGGRLKAEYEAQSHKLAAGSTFNGGPVNRLGYWDDEFRRNRLAGSVRIAALGRGVTLSGDRRTNCLARLESSRTGLEIYNFGIPLATTRDYAAQVARDVADHRPDLVLLFLSVGDELTSGAAESRWFDWRALRTWQLLALAGGLAPNVPILDDATAAANGYESKLRACLPALAACRTPVATDVERQWESNLSDLDQIAQFCARRDLPVALVLVPSVVQTNPQVFDAAVRRAGCKRESIDLDLPQRRLKSFAESRELAVLDLLPHLRNCSGNPFTGDASEMSPEGHDLTSRVLKGWLESRFERLIAAN